MTPDKVTELFTYKHLPPHLQVASKPFHDMAMRLVTDYKPSAELTLAVRHLWDAKNLVVYTAVKQSEGD